MNIPEMGNEYPGRNREKGKKPITILDNWIIREKMTDNEKMLETLENMTRDLLKDGYIKGIATGGKTFVGMVYQNIIELKESGVKPEDIVYETEKLCERLIDKNEEYINKDIEEREKVLYGNYI